MAKRLGAAGSADDSSARRAISAENSASGGGAGRKRAIAKESASEDMAAEDMAAEDMAAEDLAVGGSAAEEFASEGSAAEDLGLNRFGEVSDDQGLSLDELSRTYAALLSGDDPYQAVEPASEGEVTPAIEPLVPEGEDPDVGELTPQSILEAILFVGHPQNEPITSRYVAALMRGVRPAEIDDWVEELNEQYVVEERPVEIISSGAGYRMVLRPQWSALNRRFHGRTKEARLSQAAVDVLAIVAYNQGLTREDVDKLRDKPSGALLSQLVRRQLLRIERTATKPRRICYFTTQRFLDLFHLESLDDLPQTPE